MISLLVSRIVILVFGILYPAYSSYKAISTKNVRDYVKWMMYWVVYAGFHCIEAVADIFVSFWFPFYYEVKILFVIWLISSTTKGSSLIYRKFIHPMLQKREPEIDEFIVRAKWYGYNYIKEWGMKAFQYLSQFLVQTAIQGGNSFVLRLRRSYSLNEVDYQNANMVHPQQQTAAIQDNRRTRTQSLDESDYMSGEITDMETDSGLPGDMDNEAFRSEDSELESLHSSTTSLALAHKQSMRREIRISPVRGAGDEPNTVHQVTTRMTRSKTSSMYSSNSDLTAGGKTRKRDQDEIPYATLPRSTKRTGAKKRQTSTKHIGGSPGSTGIGGGGATLPPLTDAKH